jgi:hypothetical protein
MLSLYKPLTNSKSNMPKKSKPTLNSASKLQNAQRLEGDART